MGGAESISKEIFSALFFMIKDIPTASNCVINNKVKIDFGIIRKLYLNKYIMIDIFKAKSAFDEKIHFIIDMHYRLDIIRQLKKVYDRNGYNYSITNFIKKIDLFRKDILKKDMDYQYKLFRFDKKNSRSIIQPIYLQNFFVIYIYLELDKSLIWPNCFILNAARLSRGMYNFVYPDSSNYIKIPISYIANTDKIYYM